MPVDPIQEFQAGLLVVPLLRGLRAAALVMLAVFRPRAVIDIDIRPQERLREENLVLKHAAKSLFESTGLVDQRPPHQGVAGGGRLRLVLDEKLEKAGWLVA